MKDKMNKNSKEYYVITQFLQKVKSSSDGNVRETYNAGKLIYLDDNMDTMQTFINIISDMSENLFENAPNHLKGDFREITERDVKDLLGEYNILIYGRSGMRINSLELKKFE